MPIFGRFGYRVVNTSISPPLYQSTWITRLLSGGVGLRQQYTLTIGR